MIEIRRLYGVEVNYSRFFIPFLEFNLNTCFNNNNKPSSSTAQQRGKPPHCALRNIKINETHQSVQQHQRDKHIEMRSSTNIRKKKKKKTKQCKQAITLLETRHVKLCS